MTIWIRGLEGGKRKKKRRKETKGSATCPNNHTSEDPQPIKKKTQGGQCLNCED